MENNLLFSLTTAQDIANGAASYTAYVFNKLLETGAHFDVYYNPKLTHNQSILSDIPAHITKHACHNTADLQKLISEKKYKKIFFGSERDTEVALPPDITPVIVIHDLRFIEVPNDKYRYIYRKNIIDRLKQKIISALRPNNDAQKQRKRLSRFITHPKLKIVSVSNHTKNSVLINFPNIRDEQIHVLYCPYPNLSENLLLQNQEAAILKANHLEKDNYFLILSAGRWFKNAYRAIKAFDHLAGINNLYGKKVVVLGVTDKSYLARQIRHRKSFIFKRFAETEELQQLYKNAYSLVYPSLQEGFGIPPVEAMRYGTPVLAASTASIPEICQQGACYFNPHSIMEIENRILYLLTDKLFHSQCRKNSFERKREIGIRQKEDLDKLIELILD